MSDDIHDAAIEYHRYPRPGKLEIQATKRMVNQRDLALAYSPGVAVASTEIAKDPSQAAHLTARSNLVAVISNGTAVLGLGSIGALASKPVMEGKAVLFKKFAGVDAFDLELDTNDVTRFVDAVSLMEPSFGGINLEDIKAPECFEIEAQLRERMQIPVFHDDQHGTAICVAAAVKNGLRFGGKKIEDCRLVASGAGAAALACLNLLVAMGLPKENIVVTDLAGVVYKGRAEKMDKYKSVYAVETNMRTLDEAIEGADIFLGLSAPNVLKPEGVAKMAANPFILALANPEPEIRPELVKSVRDDALIATGRSDYPNQVNNVLCFPFIFRGALDVGATTINEEMKIAAVDAIADLAMRESSDEVASAYGGTPFRFGPEYLIPKPFDPRLMMEIPPRVARAAMDSGVATRPIEDFNQYTRQLRQFVYKSGMVMKPVFERAVKNPKRVVFAEGEGRRVLNAVQELLDEGICEPILIGRREIIEEQIKLLGLRYSIDHDVTVIDQTRNPDDQRYIDQYYALMARDGVSPEYAAQVVRTRGTALAALMVAAGTADAMICGVQGSYARHLRYLRSIVGLEAGVSDCSAVTMLLSSSGTYFLSDTHVTLDPTAEHLAETATMAARTVRRFGMTPRVALLSHSNFGDRRNASSSKMSTTRRLINELEPDLAVEGEMHADVALSGRLRQRIFPDANYQGEANVLIFPNLDAANITYNSVKILADATPVGPILMGMARPAHVLTNSATVRTIVNMTALAVVEAQELHG